MNILVAALLAIIEQEDIGAGRDNGNIVAIFVAFLSTGQRGTYRPGFSHRSDQASAPRVAEAPDRARGSTPAVSSARFES